MSTGPLDVSRYVTKGECHICGGRVWTALVIDLEAIAYRVVIDPAGCAAETYRAPLEDGEAVGWPRYTPVWERQHIRQDPSGPLWAHSCFVPRQVTGQPPKPLRASL